MISDNNLKIFSEKIGFELTDDAVPEPFKTEILNRLHILESKANDRKNIEMGGHQEHPLGENPALWMNMQYQASRFRAITKMKSNPGRIDHIDYDAQLVYPSYGFLLRRIIIRIVFILRKLRRASYPTIGLTELAYLHAPTYLLKTLRILLAKIKLITCKKTHDNH